MKGWQVFLHSVRLVVNNLGAAFRLSAVLYAASALYQVFHMWALVPDGKGGFVLPQQDALELFPLVVLSVIASLWIAVAWHRFVLVEEPPAGVLPRWHGSETLAYLGRSLMVGLIVALAALFPLLVLGVFVQQQTVILSAMVLAGAYAFLRLGVMLPAASVGRKLSLVETWKATSGEDGTFLLLSLIIVGGTLLLSVPTMVNGDPRSLITVIYNLVTGWFATMVGVSILTTLFGHFVEGRPID